ncbi:MAG: 3' terminal RNA ribose 2'-O-methyltransferase Hen1, partial [Candidatus Cybelea sp.]
MTRGDTSAGKSLTKYSNTIRPDNSHHRLVQIRFPFSPELNARNRGLFHYRNGLSGRGRPSAQRYCLGSMLLTLTSTTAPARDLGYLLRKHPDRLQSFDLPFGIAHIFYPEASDERCTLAMLIDVDPVGLVRGRPNAAETGGLIDAYVNDRPYVASSLLSVGIARVLGAGLGGRSDRPELAQRETQLEATLSPVRGSGDGLAERLFVPLGYSIEASPVSVDELARCGANERLTISGTTTLQRMLTHLYVLIPVLDGEKHYWVGDEEAEKLLRFGQDWLQTHPERELITRRYLKRAPSLARAVVAQLAALDDSLGTEAAGGQMAQREEALERPLRLQDRRIAAVMNALKGVGASSVVDIGCGEGDLLAKLGPDAGIERL